MKKQFWLRIFFGTAIMVSGFVFLPSQAGAQLTGPDCGPSPQNVCESSCSTGRTEVSNAGDCKLNGVLTGQKCCALSTGTGSSFTFGGENV